VGRSGLFCRRNWWQSTQWKSAISLILIARAPVAWASWQLAQTSLLGFRRWMAVLWQVTHWICFPIAWTWCPAVSATCVQAGSPLAWQVAQRPEGTSACLPTRSGWRRTKVMTWRADSRMLCWWQAWQSTFRCSLVDQRVQAASMMWQERQKAGLFIV